MSDEINNTPEEEKMTWRRRLTLINEGVAHGVAGVIASPWYLNDMAGQYLGVRVPGATGDQAKQTFLEMGDRIDAMFGLEKVEAQNAREQKIIDNTALATEIATVVVPGAGAARSAVTLNRGVHATDAAAAAARANMPALSRAERATLMSPADNTSTYANKLERLFSRNVDPATQERILSQMLVNARKGGLNGDSWRHISEMNNIPTSVISDFKKIHEAQSGSRLGASVDRAFGVVENAALHPYRAVGTLYKESLLAPLTVSGRALAATWGSPIKATGVAAGGVLGFSALDLTTGGASTDFLRDGAVGGFNLYTDWLEKNKDAALGLGFMLTDIDLPDLGIGKTVGDASLAVAGNVVPTLARATGASEEDLDAIAEATQHLPMRTGPFKGVGLLATQGRPSQQHPLDTGAEAIETAAEDLGQDPAALGAPVEERTPSPTARERARSAGETARGAADRAREDLEERVKDTFSVTAFMANPREQWERVKSLGKEIPGMEGLLELGDKYPGMQWGIMLGAGASLLSGKGGIRERMGAAFQGALIVGIVFDLMAPLFGKRSGVLTMVQEARRAWNESPAAPTGGAENENRAPVRDARPAITAQTPAPTPGTIAPREPAVNDPVYDPYRSGIATDVNAGGSFSQATTQTGPVEVVEAQIIPVNRITVDQAGTDYQVPTDLKTAQNGELGRGAFSPAVTAPAANDEQYKIAVNADTFNPRRRDVTIGAPAPSMG